MSNEFINILINRLDGEIANSLLELDLAEKNMSSKWAANPEHLTKEIIDSVIKYSMNRNRSLSFFKLIIRLRSILNSNNDSLLSLEEKSGIRIDENAERIIVSEDLGSIMNDNIYSKVKNIEFTISKEYSVFIADSYTKLLEKEKYEACSIIQTMQYSYN
jgi:hypothetical protein